MARIDLHKLYPLLGLRTIPLSADGKELGVVIGEERSLRQPGGS